MKKCVGTLFVFLIVLKVGLNSNSLIAQDANQSNTTNSEKQNNTPKKKPRWSSSLNYSPQTLKADELKTIVIDEIKVPTLIYWSKGRIKRGTTIILTAQGEAPSNLRFARPISLQLSSLGWEVIVPALPKADFKLQKTEASSQTQNADKNKGSNSSQNDTTKVEGNSSSTTASQAASIQTDANVFFESQSSYQNWIIKTVEESLKLKTSNSPSNLLLGNQESAYWLLELGSSNSELTQIVLIQPQKPENVADDIAQKFSRQKLPVYAFMTELDSQDPYTSAFEKQNWKAKNIRINHGLAQFEQLDPENTLIARTISGWVSSQKSNQQ